MSEMKRAREVRPVATFTSNERWFVAKLGRDVWQHKVLEFLLPSRRTQFRKAWFLGVVWYGILTRVIYPIAMEHDRASDAKDWEAMQRAYNEDFYFFCRSSEERIPYCNGRCRRFVGYQLRLYSKSIDTEDYVRKLFPGRWNESVPWKGRLPRLSLRTNSGSSESSAATSGNTKF